MTNEEMKKQGEEIGYHVVAMMLLMKAQNLSDRSRIMEFDGTEYVVTVRCAP